MSGTDNNKSAGKPAQRNRKPKQGAKKPDQRQSAKPDQQPDLQQDEKELIEAAVASPETFEAEAEAIVAEGSTGAASTAAAVAPLEILPAEAEAIVQEASTSVASTSTAVAPSETASRGALVPMDAYPIAPAASVDAFWIGFQAIANAYRDHARRSLEETFSFVERLSVVRSPEKVVELQTEFARQSCETFVADSERIWRLYSELARQIFRPLERLVGRVIQTAR